MVSRRRYEYRQNECYIAGYRYQEPFQESDVDSHRKPVSKLKLMGLGTKEKNPARLSACGVMI